MHLILTGATGLVGSAALANLLTLLPPAGPITRLTILSRRPVPMAEAAKNPAIRTILHQDFTSYPPELLAELKGAHGVVWALGISQTEVDKDTYVKITKDYTLAAADALKDLNGSDGLNFVYVSGEGATTKPGRFTPLFGRVKGETEAALLALHRSHPQFRPYSARPGGVDPTAQAEVMKAVGARRTGLLKVGDVVMMPLIRMAYKGMHSPTQQLGQALVGLAMGDGAPLTGKGVEAEGRTINNVGLRRLAGL